jgi:hypothetical protein
MDDKQFNLDNVACGLIRDRLKDNPDADLFLVSRNVIIEVLPETSIVEKLQGELLDRANGHIDKAAALLSVKFILSLEFSSEWLQAIHGCTSAPSNVREDDDK